MPATDAEIAEHMNRFLDELKWFHRHQVRIHLSPKPDGWNLKFSVPKTTKTERVDVTATAP